MANIKKIKIGSTTYDVRDDSAARKGMYVGTCASNQAALAEKTVTVDTFPVDGNGKPLIGTIIGVKYAASNTYKTDTENNIPEAAHKINVNGTGAILIYYNNAALKSSTSANTIAAGYKNRYIYYLYDGTYWVWINHSTDSNSTYSAMTQAEINAGTGTTGRTLTPALLRSNFYTEEEIDTLLANKQNKVINLLEWYTETFGQNGLPEVKADARTLTNDEQEALDELSLNNLDIWIIISNDDAIVVNYYYIDNEWSWYGFIDSFNYIYFYKFSINKTQNTDKYWISYVSSPLKNYLDLSTVAISGSYNDLSNKPTIPAAQVQSDWDATTGMGVILNKPTIPTVPTNISAFTNDAGYTTNTGTVTGITMNNGSTLSPTNGVVDLGTVITAHQDISGKADKSTTVTNVSYDSASKKIQKTINGSTSDVVTLATVATSGSYDDLSNKPTIPTVPITSIKMNGSTVSPSSGEVDLGTVITSHLDISGKADVSDFLVTYENDEVVIELPNSNIATALTTSHVVFGKMWSIGGALVRNDFRPRIYNGLTHEWTYGNTVTPQTGYLYVDIEADKIYAYVDNLAYEDVTSITLDSTIASGGTNPVASGTIYTALSNKADKATVVTVSSTGDVSQTLDSNKFYIFGTIDSLTLTLTAVTSPALAIYAGKFTTSSDWGGTGLSVPAAVSEATNNDTVEAGKTYEFNILDNIIVVKEVA